MTGFTRKAPAPALRVPQDHSTNRAQWRGVAWVAVAVLAVHALILIESPRWFSVTPPAAPADLRALETRQIAAPKPVPPSPAVAVPARPVPPPPNPVPVIEKKTLLTQKKSAPSAMENIAVPEAAPLPPVVDTAALAAPPPESRPEPEPPPPSLPSAPPLLTASAPTPTLATAVTLPASVQINYKVTGSAKGLQYTASATLDWINTGSNYEARTTVSAFLLGARSLASSGQIGADGLAPQRFADKSRKRELAAHFEPDKQQISFSNNAPSAPWLRGAQDRMSVFLQLAGMLAGSAANPAAIAAGSPAISPAAGDASGNTTTPGSSAGFPVGSTLTFYTAGPGSADMWLFQVDGDELLSLPAGQMPAFKLTRQLRGEYDPKLEVWYAPSLGYLPVRIKYTQANNDFIDQQLDNIKRR